MYQGRKLRNTRTHTRTHAQGIVEVPLKAASAADPVGAAMRANAGPAHEEAKHRRRAAYQHIFSTLRMLVRFALVWFLNQSSFISLVSSGPVPAHFLYAEHAGACIHRCGVFISLL